MKVDQKSIKKHNYTLAAEDPKQRGSIGYFVFVLHHSFFHSSFIFHLSSFVISFFFCHSSSVICHSSFVIRHSSSSSSSSSSSPTQVQTGKAEASCRRMKISNKSGHETQPATPAAAQDTTKTDVAETCRPPNEVLKDLGSDVVKVICRTPKGYLL